MGGRPRGELPDPIRKREVLYAEEPDRQALGAIGQQFLAADRLSEALDFFERAGDVDGLHKVLALAREEADYFVLDRCARALGMEPGPSDWAALGDRAESLGKERFAYQFRLRAGLQVSPPAPEPVTPPPAGALLAPLPAPESGDDGPWVDSSAPRA